MKSVENVFLFFYCIDWLKQITDAGKGKRKLAILQFQCQQDRLGGWTGRVVDKTHQLGWKCITAVGTTAEFPLILSSTNS